VIKLDVYNKVKELNDYIINLRREFHEQPETSLQEHRTKKVIKQELSKANISYEDIEAGGIIGYINGEHKGKTIVLRADIDALPIKESSENLLNVKESISKIEGKAHMCGHDGHTAMLLGAAKILSQHKNQLNGNVLLAFEQGEEKGQGVYKLLKRLLEIGADGVWGIHLKSDLQAGKISVEPGARMASACSFDVLIEGKSGHASRPDLAISPIDCFYDFYGRFKDIKNKYLNPFDPITFSVGSVQAGKTGNVIPGKLRFQGTIRYLNYKQGLKAEEKFREILKKTTEMNNCHYEYLRSPSAKDSTIYNHPGCSTIAENAVKKTLGKKYLKKHPIWMASDTYSYYLRYFPGVYAFLGIKNEELGTGAEHHNPKFDLDESALKNGTAITVQYTLDFLNNKKPIVFTEEKESLHSLFVKNKGYIPSDKKE